MNESAITHHSEISKTTTKKKGILGIIFFTVFLDLIGFGIIIPIQPFYAKMLGASATVVTLIGASFSLMQFLFAPVWGRLSDRVGRRPIMLLSIAAAAVGYTLFGFSNSLGTLIFARMLAGAGSANIGTAQAIIADSTPPDQRAKGMGLIGAAFGLGFIFGPAIGGLLVRYGFTTPIFFAAGLCTLNLILATFILPETLPKGASKTHLETRGFSWKTLKHVARHPRVPQLFSIFLLFTWGFSMMEQVLALLVEKTWLGAETGVNATAHATHAAELTTKVLIVVGVTATLIQGGLIGRLVKKYGENRLLVTGLLCTTVGLALFPVIAPIMGFNGFLLLGALIAVGSALSNPSLTSLLSRTVTKDEQGAALGSGQSLSALGRVLGPMLAGFLFELSPGIPFWGAAAMSLVCAGIAFVSLNRV